MMDSQFQRVKRVDKASASIQSENFSYNRDRKAHSILGYHSTNTAGQEL